MTTVKRRGMVRSGRRLLGGSSLRRTWRRVVGDGADLTSQRWPFTASSTSGRDSRKVIDGYHDVCNPPINNMPHYPLYGLTGDLIFPKNECPPIGALFSSQNTSVKTAKLFSFSVFR